MESSTTRTEREGVSQRKRAQKWRPVRPNSPDVSQEDNERVENRHSRDRRSPLSRRPPVRSLEERRPTRRSVPRSEKDILSVSSQLSAAESKLAGGFDALREKTEELREEIRETKKKVADKGPAGPKPNEDIPDPVRFSNFIENLNKMEGFTLNLHDRVGTHVYLWAFLFTAQLVLILRIAGVFRIVRDGLSIIVALALFYYPWSSVIIPFTYFQWVIVIFYYPVVEVALLLCAWIVGFNVARIAAKHHIIPEGSKILREQFIVSTPDLVTSKDMRADSLALGKLKHEAAVAEVVYYKRMTPVWVPYVLTRWVKTDMRCSYELLAQMTVLKNFSLISGENVNWERTNYALERFHSVNIDKYDFIGHDILQGTSLVLRGLRDKKLEDLEFVDFPRAVPSKP